MSLTPYERVSDEGPGAGGFGLLANGSSRLWDIAVDESLEREGEWSIELDGKTNYLIFQLRDLHAIAEAIDYLQRGLSEPETSNQQRRTESAYHLILGKFGTYAVWLEWDDELPLRLFLIVGPNARPTMRLTLQREDAETLLEALRQVADDLPPEAK